jgi:mono/diheme cytochrome c family protein
MTSFKTFLLAAPFAFAAFAPTLSVAQDFSAELVEKGRYLATASDCVACHTAKGGKPMAGGLAIDSPVGTIMSTNITPSKETGIGNYTEAQFSDAVRKGVRADGANLYPAMPYTAYSFMSDEDVHAMYAYFMKGVVPVEEKNAETSLPFPMNIRASMIGWNLLFRNNTPLADDPKQSAEWNRGRYLAEGAAHCSTCHTPRGLLMQEQTSLNLSGAQVGPWYAPDITSDKVTGIGTWSQDELVTYLKTGRLAGKAQAAGSMGEAITHSFQHLTDADLKAIATYVESVPSTHPAAASSGATRFDQGKPVNELAALRGKGFDNGMKGAHSGAQIFSANCASCHGFNGQGTADGYYPSIFHNSATAGVNASNLIATILYGVERETESGHVFMPPFGDQPNAVTRLDNVEVASLANYILKDYGNSKLTVTAHDVGVIREGGPKSDIVTLARIGMGAGALVVLALIAMIVILPRRGRTGSDKASA